MAHQANANANGSSDLGLGAPLQRRNSHNSILSIRSIFSIRSWLGSREECGKVVVYEPLDKKLSLEDLATVNGMYRVIDQTECLRLLDNICNVFLGLKLHHYL